MNSEQVRHFILITGWPALFACSVYLLYKAVQFYHAVQRDRLGKLMLTVVIGWLLTMYSLGYITTLLMLHDESSTLPVVLPIFAVWFVSMLLIITIVHNFQKGALRIVQFHRGLQTVVREQTAALTQRTEGLEERVKQRTDELEEQVKKLQQQKEQFEQLSRKSETTLSSIFEGIVSTDKTGVIERCNLRVTQLLGLSQEELTGKNLGEAIKLFETSGAEVALENRPFMRAIKTGEPQHGIYTLQTKDERTFVADIMASPIKTGDEIFGVVSVIRDITEAYAVDKAKTEFVSLASHQLRTPLTAIKWFLETMLEGDYGPLSRLQRPHVKEVYESANRMIELISALLQTSRIELGKLEFSLAYVNVEEMVRRILGDLKPQIQEKQLKMEVFFSPNMPDLHADPRLLSMVLLNLISNAVKYTKEEGSVTIGCEQRGDGFYLTVSDTGIGIPQHQQEQLFTRLFRADNARVLSQDGSGLGLYIVKQILDKCGGKVTVSSIENKGTTFTVYLPPAGMIPDAAATPVAPKPAIIDPEQKNG